MEPAKLSTSCQVRPILNLSTERTSMALSVYVLSDSSSAYQTLSKDSGIQKVSLHRSTKVLLYFDYSMVSLMLLLQFLSKPKIAHKRLLFKFLSTNQNPLLDYAIRPRTIIPGMCTYHPKNGYEMTSKFKTRDQAFEVISRWIDRYHTERPHSSLSYLTPALFVQN